MYMHNCDHTLKTKAQAHCLRKLVVQVYKVCSQGSLKKKEQYRACSGCILSKIEYTTKYVYFLNAFFVSFYATLPTK